MLPRCYEKRRDPAGLGMNNTSGGMPSVAKQPPPKAPLRSEKVEDPNLFKTREQAHICGWVLGYGHS